MTYSITIAAKDVKVGDYLWNSLAKHPPYQWVRVVSIEQKENNRIALHTSGWYTVKHREEGIEVRVDLSLSVEKDSYSTSSEQPNTANVSKD
jgi:hypothetical protein